MWLPGFILGPHLTNPYLGRKPKVANVVTILHLRLIIHLKLSKSPMDYFKMNLHVGIVYKF